MKVSYRREMKHNYLIVNPESVVWCNYECRMLAANTIEGVLHFQIRQLDDEIRFFYEITSKQPLSRMLESRLIEKEEIRRLVLGISSVLDRMELYLLREGCVLLEPEYIYVEPDTYRVWLCLVPGMERDFPEAYGKLLEYILGKVNHQDKESVVLAYGLYQETRKENYGMEDILRLLSACEEKSLEESMEKSQPVEKQDFSTGFLKEASCVESKDSVLNRFLGRFRSGNRRKEKAVESQWEMAFMEENNQPLNQALNQPLNPLPKLPKQQPNRSPETVLLKAETSLALERENRGGRYLQALSPEEPDIEISYYPFIIGKQENLVDYFLNRDTVSRLHVRIDRNGEGYEIQDLNSTNGTMVNGHLLENNETVKLQKGDEVKIAGFSYRFQ